MTIMLLRWAALVPLNDPTRGVPGMCAGAIASAEAAAPTGVSESHVMTSATVDRDGCPALRVLTIACGLDLGMQRPLLEWRRGIGKRAGPVRRR